MATVDISNFDEEFRSEKIVHKRRSSIFHTRIITRSQNEDGNEATSNEDKSTPSKDKEECNIQNDVEIFNLKEYIEKLRQERKDWQQEYRNRKTQRKNLTMQKINLEEQGQVLDINILTESERAFLLTRPNYEHIGRNNQKLLDVTLKISTLSQHVHKLNRRFMERMENNISKVTREIIKMTEQ